MGKDILFDATLGFAMEVLNVEDAFTDLVELLDAPSAMIGVAEVLERIAMRIEQGRAQAKCGVGNLVFEQP